MRDVTLCGNAHYLISDCHCRQPAFKAKWPCRMRGFECTALDFVRSVGRGGRRVRWRTVDSGNWQHKHKKGRNREVERDAEETGKPNYCITPSCNSFVHFHYPCLHLRSLTCARIFNCSADWFVNFRMGRGGGWVSAVWIRFKKRGRVHFYAVKVHAGSGGIASRFGLFIPLCTE
jgi:hypothetical protein